jgi:hypothetical protein
MFTRKKVYPDLFVDHVTVSGLSGSKEEAQSQVLIGMGLLAGSTVFLLTLLWGTCVVVGKCDLGPTREAVDLTDTKGFSLTGIMLSLMQSVLNGDRLMVVYHVILK